MNKKGAIEIRGARTVFIGKLLSFLVRFNLLRHSYLSLPHESHFKSEVAIIHNSFSKTVNDVY